MVPNSNIVMGPNATENCIVDSAGIYTVKVRAEVPYRPAGDNGTSNLSSQQVLVKQNGSTKRTLGGQTNDPSISQEEVDGVVVLNCAANDTISIVSSSSSIPDIYQTRILVSIYQGP